MDGAASIMLDTRPSSDILLHNVDAIGADLRKTDAILLSHGYYDHVGGLIDALKRIAKSVPVTAHPKILNPKFRVREASNS